MATKNALTTVRDPFALLRQVASELDRAFDAPGWSSLRWPLLDGRTAEAGGWTPRIDVFQRENRLVTKIDLPGLKKDDVKVEVSDGQLEISGERRTESEEKRDDFYRSEREFGSFYRAVPLPDGVTLADVKAIFTNGVLEVSVPLPAKAEPKVHKVEIQDGGKAVQAA
jgi:HSP20 family protein